MSNQRTPLTNEYENRLGYWRVHGLRVRIGVQDARRDGGRLRFLVTPIHGKDGGAWVDASKVDLDKVERTGTHG